MVGLRPTHQRFPCKWKRRVPFARGTASRRLAGAAKPGTVRKHGDNTYDSKTIIRRASIVQHARAGGSSVGAINKFEICAGCPVKRGCPWKIAHRHRDFCCKHEKQQQTTPPTRKHPRLLEEARLSCCNWRCCIYLRIASLSHRCGPTVDCTHTRCSGGAISDISAISTSTFQKLC